MTFGRHLLLLQLLLRHLEDFVGSIRTDNRAELDRTKLLERNRRTWRRQGREEGRGVRVVTTVWSEDMAVGVVSPRCGVKVKSLVGVMGGGMRLGGGFRLKFWDGDREGNLQRQSGCASPGGGRRRFGTHPDT